MKRWYSRRIITIVGGEMPRLLLDDNRRQEDLLTIFGRWLIAGLYSLTGFPSRLRGIRQLAVNFDNKICSTRIPGEGNCSLLVGTLRRVSPTPFWGIPVVWHNRGQCALQ